MGPGPDSGAINSSPGGFSQPKSAEASLGMDASGCDAPWASRAEPGTAPAQNRLARIMPVFVSFLVRVIGENANIENSPQSARNAFILLPVTRQNENSGNRRALPGRLSLFPQSSAAPIDC